jgi:glucose-6-phosphate dehydrogenase assembly protein OpcA
MAAAVIPNADELLEALEHERRDRGGICTTSLNVIAFVENDAALLQWLAENGGAFAESHGFRILVLDGSRGAEQSTVRTHCKEMGNTLVTSFEQIQLGVADLAAPQLRSIVHDLLTPNVRNVMLWGGSRVQDDRFGALSDLAERIVLFSSADSGIERLRELASLDQAPIAQRLRDLAYMRLLAWQDLTAQFFDDPDLASELPSINRVEITSGSDAEAYYLAGWFASRLGWQPCGEIAFCNASGAAIRIDLRKEGLPRRIRAIRLHSPSCTFGIAVSPDAEDLVCLTVEGRKKRPMRCLPLHDIDVVSLVERAIFSSYDGGVYLETLGLLKRVFEWTDAR